MIQTQKLRPRHWTNGHSVTKSNNLDMLLILFSMTCTTPRPHLQRTPLPSLLRFTGRHNQTSQFIEYRVRSKDCTISFSDHSGFGATLIINNKPRDRLVSENDFIESTRNTLYFFCPERKLLFPLIDQCKIDRAVRWKPNLSHVNQFCKSC